MKRHLTAVFFLAIWSPGFAAKVALIDVKGDSSRVRLQAEDACRFYGLQLITLDLEEHSHAEVLQEIAGHGDLLAVIVNAETLSRVEDPRELTATILELNGKLPFLLVNLDSGIASVTLSRLAGVDIDMSTIDEPQKWKSLFQFGYVSGVTGQLSGFGVPLSCEGSADFFKIPEDGAVRTLLKFSKHEGDRGYPVYLRTRTDGNARFFAARLPLFTLADPDLVRVNEGAFELIPILMFLKNVGGERIWHSAGYYANFTIDDPWLTEPYGHVSYRQILQHMRRANFHTTIAFIPWNFDRSQPEVVSLFQQNPDRFSVSIHGNNHDHREFYLERVDLMELKSASPLPQQEADIRQAIARMERFTELTGVNYEPVMVFPQRIGTEKALHMLKKYNFLATVNGVNVPIDCAIPDDPLFSLRPVTTRFANFPSISRYYPTTNPFEIALDLFLGNPVLFYTHHDFFQSGTDAFNRTAELVNTVQPDIHWTSLQRIVNRLYLQRLREDGDYDILAFANNIVVENHRQKDVIYHLSKSEDFEIPLKHVLIDGQKAAYESREGVVEIVVAVPAGESRQVRIEFENDLDVSKVDISKQSYRVAALRHFADFRDMTLSTNVLGRPIVDFYYEYGLFKLGLLWLAVLVLVSTLIFAMYRKRRRLGHVQVGN